MQVWNELMRGRVSELFKPEMCYAYNRNHVCRLDICHSVDILLSRVTHSTLVMGLDFFEQPQVNHLHHGHNSS